MKMNAVFKLVALATLVVLGAMYGCSRDEPQLPASPQSSDQLFGSAVTSDEALAKFRSSVSSGQTTPPDPTIAAPRAPRWPHREYLEQPATITPPSLSLYLRENECEHVSKTVYLPGNMITRADILFTVDVTGSMGGELAQLQAEIQDIADQLGLLIDEPAFGVVSYRDYENGIDYCGYDGFGFAGDYPYVLNQAINADVNLTKTAINGLATFDGAGGDGPESYTRVLYESYSDPAVGWRPGARRIVVNFGDNVPHDCDIGSCLGLAWGTTGTDPGRDAALGTADDLAIMSVLSGMNTNSVTLFEVYSGDFAGSDEQFAVWQCWAAETPNGVAVRINGDGTVPGGMDLAQMISDLVEPILGRCDVLTLKPTPGFEGWVKNLTPPQYDGVVLPDTLSFALDICVPPGTPEGMYVFQICAACDLGEEVCEADTVYVLPPFIPYLDIHPGSCPNPINVGSPGLTPAALLGTADFDVTEVDPSTLRLAGVASTRWNMEDVATPLVDGMRCECTTAGPDGYTDLTLKFSTQALVAAIGPVNEGDVVVLTITGEFWDGTPFEAPDCVVIHGAKKGLHGD